MLIVIFIGQIPTETQKNLRQAAIVSDARALACTRQLYWHPNTGKPSLHCGQAASEGFFVWKRPGYHCSKKIKWKDVDEITICALFKVVKAPQRYRSKALTFGERLMYCYYNSGTIPDSRRTGLSRQLQTPLRLTAFTLRGRTQPMTLSYASDEKRWEVDWWKTRLTYPLWLSQYCAARCMLANTIDNYRQRTKWFRVSDRTKRLYATFR